MNPTLIFNSLNQETKLCRIIKSINTNPRLIHNLMLVHAKMGFDSFFKMLRRVLQMIYHCPPDRVDSVTSVTILITKTS